MRHPQSFLDNTTVNIESPGRQTCLQPKFPKEFCGTQIDMLFSYIFPAEIHHRFVGQGDFLAEVTEHRHAPQRRR